jgi:hypothetical protein
MKAKSLFNLGMVIMLLITSFAVSQPAAAEAPAKFAPRFAADAETVPGEVVVAFNDSQDKNLVEKIEQAVDTANDAGGEVTRLSLDGDAVIQVDGDTTDALAALNQQPDVLYAEPNYIYSAPESEIASSDGSSLDSNYVFQDVNPSASTNWLSTMAVPNSSIQSLVAMGTYPNDTYFATNSGWFSMGAGIVWPNATASANICEIDTGVDNVHPDLWYKYTKVVNGVTKTFYVYRVIQGYDFVNGDTNTADDNGHGTHVAGIMVALKNNAMGISGVSTGNVVAVKALDAQGTGTNFDVTKAIQYCANRTDVRVINLSLGGPAPSTALENALIYATTPTTQVVPWSNPLPGCTVTKTCIYGKGKLVVVAAGNTSVDSPATQETYPAAYAVDPDFPNNRILSVASTGRSYSSKIRYQCASLTTKYGAWVTVAAPGENIYSTTPYDKPFYKNYYEATNTRYDYMSGTSMAAAFVSASAARRMGYKPLETNEQVGTIVRNSGDAMGDNATFAGCTPNEMTSLKRVNVATLMDRAAVRVSVFDAAAGVPLNGASVAVSFLNDGVSSLRTALISPDASKALVGEDVDPNRVFTYYISFTDVLDVPTVSTHGVPITSYNLLVSKAGYTSGYQAAFKQDHLTDVTVKAGVLNVFTDGAVPPATADFNIVLGWQKWNQFAKAADSFDDLDLYVWLPDDSLNTDPGQPASFVVGYDGDPFGSYVQGDSYGTMTDFPFARLKREGGFSDGGPLVESTSIAPRTAHGTVAANIALPYWAGAYTIMATDYGQTIDHDNDGCGNNYGFDYSPTYTPGAECSGKTLGIALLGAYYTPYVYVWKNGVVQHFDSSAKDFGPWNAEIEPAEDTSNCNDHWWKALRISSTTTSTAPTYFSFGAPNAPVCDDGNTPGFVPYATYVDQPNDRIKLLNK